MNEFTNKTKILAIETSATNCGLALTIGDDIVAEYYTKGSNLHDRLLAEFTKRILSDFDLKPKDLSAVAISAGPGSFTGLRIGAAFAKALTFTDDVKLIAVPTLDALAFNVHLYLPNSKRIVATQLSHKDLLYYRIYDSQANPIGDIRFEEEEKFRQELQSDDVLCGNYNLHEGQNTLFSTIKAGHIALYAIELYKKGAFTKSEDFSPIYVQDFQVKNK